MTSAILPPGPTDPAAALCAELAAAAIRAIITGELAQGAALAEQASLRLREIRRDSQRTRACAAVEAIAVLGSALERA